LAKKKGLARFAEAFLFLFDEPFDAFDGQLSEFAAA
jgi:hypothetical protein